MAEQKYTIAKKGKENPPVKPFKRKMSKDPSKGEKLRCKVYDAVAKTLLKRRSDSFTLDEIAAQIGGSKGTLYYYFKSKGDILYKLNLHFWGFVQESVISFIDNPGLTAREKLSRLIRNYITVSCEHWQLSSALWNDVALREVNAIQAGSINKSRKEYIRYITMLVEETIKEEKLEPVNPKVVALMIFSQIVHVSTWYKKGGDLSAEEIADYAVKMVFRGILNKNYKV